MKINHTLLALVTAFILPSCASGQWKYEADYNMGLSQVTINNTDQTSKIAASHYSFQSEGLNFEFRAFPSVIKYKITNNTNEEIQLIWDKSSLTYLDVFKKVHTSRVYPTKITDKRVALRPIAPALIKVGKSLSGILAPTSRMVSTQPGFSERSPILSHMKIRALDKDKKQFEKTVSSYKGKPLFHLKLKMMASGKMSEYIFAFKSYDPRVLSTEP